MPWVQSPVIDGLLKIFIDYLAKTKLIWKYIQNVVCQLFAVTIIIIIVTNIPKLTII